ncbi:hypothetical protein KP509_36G023500 [Ceratopteris richardii]|uniref:Alpha/beta hydrolase fold-3 domain-containing protein n=1 Tax=Ceratopteris richardii TaxID=49495 RepID=A0A8T2QBD3_CERRI|nr:hypothetical protein KP509_36G023500 [Ceratopteris richardii]
MASLASSAPETDQEVSIEFQDTNLVIYSDGTVHRTPWSSAELATACPSPSDADQVATKDIVLNPQHGTMLRLFLPPSASSGLPVLLYFHGGGFTNFVTALHPLNAYLSRLAAHCAALVVSVDYRLAPEHPLPAAYEDCFEALLWLEKQAEMAASGDSRCEAWLADHADFSRCILIGDSAGGTIVHYVGMQALGHGSWVSDQEQKRLKHVALTGMLLCHPFFTCGRDEKLMHDERGRKLFKYLNITIDSPLIDPLSSSSPPLAAVHLPPSIVFVAGQDMLKHCGIAYHDGLLKAGKESKLSCTEEEEHVFHILKPNSPHIQPFLDEVRDFIHPNLSRN